MQPRHLAVGVLVFAAASVAAGCSWPWTIPEPSEVRGRPTAYVWYEWPDPHSVSEPNGFFNFDVELTIEKEAPPGYGLYWAHQFSFMDQASIGYMGLQQGSHWAPGAGKIAIFAIWNALAAEEGPGCSCTYFGNEGEGWSCHVRYDWVEGRKYLLRIWTIAAEVAEAGGQWWGAWVSDTETREETFIGKILVPAEWKWLHSSVVWGAEYFTLNPTGPCSNAPYAAAVFGNPTADNGAFEPYHATVKYSVCPNSNVTSVGGRGALLETGGNTLRTTPEDSLVW
jgi:hypothetical protein